MSSLDQSVNLSCYSSDITYHLENEKNLKSHYKPQNSLLSSLNSIKNNSNYNYCYSAKPIRKDKFGKEILKKSTTHRISYADQFEKPGREFVQVIKVTSIKDLYNITRGDIDGKKCFGCSIF